VGDPQLVAVAERMPDPEQIAMLAFMDRAGDDTHCHFYRQERRADVRVDDQRQAELFKRGESKTVKRYYVDLTSRA
jgi:hypothetical protein